VGLLRSIAHERDAAVLLVTHDLEAATIADRRCTLRDGKLIHGDVDTDASYPSETRSQTSSRAG
jgi:ABC-type lipoprotein export system ATPase subunit